MSTPEKISNKEMDMARYSKTYCVAYDFGCSKLRLQISLIYNTLSSKKCIMIHFMSDYNSKHKIKFLQINDSHT